MNGVTVATPEWEEIAREAVLRFTHFTGMPAALQVVETQEQARDFKLSLKGKAWFFDADVWFVQDVTLPDLTGACVYGTPLSVAPESREIVRGYARRANVDPGVWITGSLYGSDWDATAPAIALACARHYARQWAISDRDEEPLNAGYQRAGLPVALLPSALNWHPLHGVNGYGYAPVTGPAAIHAGGMGLPADRLAFLRKHTLPL